LVKSLSGHVHKGHDGLVYGKPRKQSKRENRYCRTTATNRKTAPRERAAIIMLRKKGYTYNQLASAFIRSTSYIYKVIRNAMNCGVVSFHDYRAGISDLTKKLTCNNRLGTLILCFSSWIAFIEGAEDKPP
jgi:hypothetical protein